MSRPLARVLPKGGRGSPGRSSFFKPGPGRRRRLEFCELHRTTPPCNPGSAQCPASPVNAGEQSGV